MTTGICAYFSPHPSHLVIVSSFGASTMVSPRLRNADREPNGIGAGVRSGPPSSRFGLASADPIARFGPRGGGHDHATE
jgi:hypothetical protein